VNCLRFAPLLALLATAGCSIAFCLDESAFSRDADLFSGEIHGQAVDERGERIPYAQVTVPGTQRTVRADSEGAFVLWDLTAGSWVLKVTSDADGDGIPERRRVLATTLREVEHRRQTEFIPGVTNRPTELTGIDVGAVTLEGTAEVGGRVLITPPGGGDPVPPAQLGKNVVVLAARNFGLPREASDGVDLVSLGAEVKTGVDAEGDFLLRNVGAGSLHLLLLVFDATVQVGDLSGFERASAPVFVRAQADETATLGQPLVLPDFTPTTLEITSMQLLVTPPPPGSEEMYAVFVPPGRESPPCEFPPPDYSTLPSFSHARTTAVRPAASLVTFADAPVGLWDVKVCVSGAAAAQGVLYEQTVQTESADVPAALVGPVLLGEAVDPCLQYRGRCRDDADCGAGSLVCDKDAEGDDTGRCVAPSDEPYLDCDGDGVRGLPPVPTTGEVPAVWSACAEACTVGDAPLGERVCSFEENGWDCDDDGDGQADVTEDPACYGIGKGIDSDSDGICDGLDQFPECTANNATDCVAGTDDEPQVRPEFQEVICAIRLTGEESEPGAGVLTYCDANGQVGFDCEGYQMHCEVLDESGAVAELFPRRCGDQGDCAAPSAFAATAECVDGLCAFDNPDSCDRACPFGFDCVSDLVDVDRCVAIDALEATVVCSCNNATVPGSDRVVEVAGVALHSSHCDPDNSADTALQTLWTSTGEAGCGFPPPSPPRDAEPDLDGGVDVAFDAGQTGDIEVLDGFCGLLNREPTFDSYCSATGNAANMADMPTAPATCADLRMDCFDLPWFNVACAVGDPVLGDCTSVTGFDMQCVADPRGNGDVCRDQLDQSACTAVDGPDPVCTALADSLFVPPAFFECVDGRCQGVAGTRNLRCLCCNSTSERCFADTSGFVDLFEFPDSTTAFTGTDSACLEPELEDFWARCATLAFGATAATDGPVPGGSCDVATELPACDPSANNDLLICQDDGGGGLWNSVACAVDPCGSPRCSGDAAACLAATGEMCIHPEAMGSCQRWFAPNSGPIVPTSTQPSTHPPVECAAGESCVLRSLNWDDASNACSAGTTCSAPGWSCSGPSTAEFCDGTDTGLLTQARQVDCDQLSTGAVCVAGEGCVAPMGGACIVDSAADGAPEGRAPLKCELPDGGTLACVDPGGTGFGTCVIGAG